MSEVKREDEKDGEPHNSLPVLFNKKEKNLRVSHRLVRRLG